MKCITSSLFMLLMIFTLAGCMESTPESQPLFLPRDSEKPSDTAFAKTDSLVSLILTANNVFHYVGKFNDQTQVSSVSYKNLRDVVLYYQKRFGANLVIAIKPHENATYRIIVDVLDEMTVNDIKKYAMIDLTDEERKTLNLPASAATDSK
jgi:biopolymer transport protein ExbD